MAEAGRNGAISWNRYGYRFNGAGPYQRVTTIKAKKGSGNALVDWAARMVAERAQSYAQKFREGGMGADELVVALMDENLKNAHNETRDRAADFGTIFHHFVENLSAGDQDVLHVAEEEVRRAAVLQLAARDGASLGDDRAIRLYEQKLNSADKEQLEMLRSQAQERLWPDIEAFLDWHDKERPEFVRSEFQVFSDKHNYAGSVDCDMRLRGCRVIGDVKTSKSVYKDYALQLAAYRYAEFVGEPDGSQTAVPEYDTGAILHIRDGKVKVIEVDCGPGAFDAFVACWTLYNFDRFHPEPKEFQPRLALDATEAFA